MASIIYLEDRIGGTHDDIDILRTKISVKLNEKTLMSIASYQYSYILVHYVFTTMNKYIIRCHSKLETTKKNQPLTRKN